MSACAVCDGALPAFRDQVLAVIGDNGAGKSSLIKALSGAVQLDAGEIRLEGKPINFKSPLEARDAGIETVYQTLALSPRAVAHRPLMLHSHWDGVTLADLVFPSFLTMVGVSIPLAMAGASSKPKPAALTMRIIAVREKYLPRLRAG